MAPAQAGDGTVARLRNEARVLARLEHPGLVPVHDIGTLPDGRLFYVMRLVRGRRLDEHARQERSLPALLRLFERVCEAVAFAHAQGVLHRDLKPANVMVGPFGEVLVLDWGLAKQVDVAAVASAAVERRSPAAAGHRPRSRSPTRPRGRSAAPCWARRAHGARAGARGGGPPRPARGRVRARRDVALPAGGARRAAPRALRGDRGARRRRPTRPGGIRPCPPWRPTCRGSSRRSRSRRTAKGRSSACAACCPNTACRWRWCRLPGHARAARRLRAGSKGLPSCG